MPKEINFYNYEHGYAVSLNHKETLYTQSELNQAVEAEREACAKICDLHLVDNKNYVERQGYHMGLRQCAESIRTRSKDR